MADGNPEVKETDEPSEGSETSQVQGQTLDDSHVRGVYSFVENRQEAINDAMDSRRGHRADETALRAMERRHSEELFGQRQRHIEEEHAQRMRLMEQNQAANAELLKTITAALAFAALGTQNADQASMNAQTVALAGILSKALTQVPPVTTATGNPGTPAAA